ncbi:MAG: DUF1987 domain-containing protein [Salinivirgaceae bacterium]
MNPLIIEQTPATPKIHFDFTHKLFEIIGCSRPEDVRIFYMPIIDWLESFKLKIPELEKPVNPLEFKFKFDYFNSSSAKFLLDILVLINQIHQKGMPIKVAWYFDENDDDMKEVGEELSEVVDLPFEYIEVPKKTKTN